MKKIFVTLHYKGRKSVRGYILDISRIGMGIAASKKIEKNTEVKVIPRRKTIPSCRGKVVYSVTRKKKIYPYKLGLKFKALSNQSRQGIRRFLSANERRRRGRTFFR